MHRFGKHVTEVTKVKMNEVMKNKLNSLRLFDLFLFSLLSSHVSSVNICLHCESCLKDGLSPLMLEMQLSVTPRVLLEHSPLRNTMYIQSAEPYLNLPLENTPNLFVLVKWPLICETHPLI